ncbi:TolC family protein [Sediminibacterium soli]|uniref:TolC family protein n=1 Tax=Sediminibacterium soli TaxID=2698829 RepID=UPI00137B9317|nr:TolC family protein [Sediminibacterium soli]NCI45157.1 TolC family protein [Sediminibacterium soli]
MKQSLVIAFCLLGLQSYSQQSLSLLDAVNAALKNSYDIQIARNNLEISSVNNYIGIAGGLPTVTATANDNEQITTINQKFNDASRNTSRSNVGSNNLTMGVTGSMLLFNGWRVVATKHRLEELEKQNQQVLNAQVQNTIAAVMSKYYDVVRQQNLLNTIQTSITASQQRLDIVKARREVGLANNADLFQAQIDLNALLQSLQSQQLVINTAKTDLQSLLSVKPDSMLRITDTLITIDRTLNLDSVKAAMQANPQLIAANRQVNISELIEKETAAQRYPTLRASTGYNFNSSQSAAGFSLLNQSYGPFISLNLSVPIYNGTIFKRQQKVAEINTRNAALIRDDLYLSFENSALRNYQAYANAIGQLKTQQQTYDIAKQLLDVTLQRFRQGVGTLVEVKLAQQSFETEGYRLVNLNYLAKVAEVELKRLSNRLTPQ